MIPLPMPVRQKINIGVRKKSRMCHQFMTHPLLLLKTAWQNIWKQLTFMMNLTSNSVA